MVKHIDKNYDSGTVTDTCYFDKVNEIDLSIAEVKTLPSLDTGDDTYMISEHIKY